MTSRCTQAHIEECVLFLNYKFNASLNCLTCVLPAKNVLRFSPPVSVYLQVILSEIYTDPGGTRAVVKELKANASAKEQNDFLQLGDPYR